MATLHLNFRSDALKRSVYPVVFLPDYNGVGDCPPPYPTLYFLTGYSGGALETATFTNFALFSATYGLAIVLSDGENSFYVDDPARNAYYSRFAGDELVEATRALLPLSHKREDTFIGGISMSGYGALINGLRYPDRFGKIAMLSPALGLYPKDESPTPGDVVTREEMLSIMGDAAEYYGSYKDYNAASAKATKRGMPQMYIACGNRDPLVLDACRAYAQNMGELGAPLTYTELDGGHDHDFWKAAMSPLCEFLTAKGGK